MLSGLRCSRLCLHVCCSAHQCNISKKPCHFWLRIRNHFSARILNNMSEHIVRAGFQRFQTSVQQITRLSKKCSRIAFFAELSSNRATVGDLAGWNGRGPRSCAHCAAQAQPRDKNGCMPKRVGLSRYPLRAPLYTGRWSHWRRAESGPRRCAIIGTASALRCHFWLRFLNHVWLRIFNHFWQIFSHRADKPLPFLVTNPSPCVWRSPPFLVGKS